MKVNKSVQEPQNISHAEGAETLYFHICKQIQDSKNNCGFPQRLIKCPIYVVSVTKQFLVLQGPPHFSQQLLGARCQVNLFHRTLQLPLARAQSSWLIQPKVQSTRTELPFIFRTVLHHGDSKINNLQWTSKSTIYRSVSVHYIGLSFMSKPQFHVHIFPKI